MQLYLTANISVHFNNSGGIPMIIDSAKLNGPCSCGRSHEMITKEAIIEPGCLKKTGLLYGQIRNYRKTRRNL